MNTTTYPFGNDRDDRDLARVQADLRALPMGSTTTRHLSRASLLTRLRHVVPGRHVANAHPAVCS